LGAAVKEADLVLAAITTNLSWGDWPDRNIVLISRSTSCRTARSFASLGSGSAVEGVGRLVGGVSLRESARR